MHRPASILVVDDEVDTCRNLSDILTDLGYQVDVAHSGESALELVKGKSYDLALLDLKMPGMDGLTLFREIKKLRAGTVAIIVTAYAGGSTKEEALAEGALQVLPKPVDFPQLLNLVAQALNQPLVMVVDDDPDLCTNLWDLFKERGYRVCVAHDERAAAERLKERAFRVVLIDMKLAQSDGTRVFRLVRESNPQARTIIITGFRSETDQLVQQVMHEGADAVCYKPFDVPNLLSMLQQLANKVKKVPQGSGQEKTEDSHTGYGTNSNPGGLGWPNHCVRSWYCRYSTMTPSSWTNTTSPKPPPGSKGPSTISFPLLASARLSTR